MRIHLKKRFTALMLAGMMVTSNVLPAYSATDGIAVEQADASYEADAASADASADAENLEAGGASSEQGDAGKPVIDADDTDSTTDASTNAGAGSGVVDVAAGEQTTANKSEATDGAATEESKSDAANGAATEESKADAANGTVTEESKSDVANGAETEESKSDAAHGTGAEESKADAGHGSHAGGSSVVGAGSVGIDESTGAAVEIEETKPAELLEEETKLATESEISKEEDEKKFEENRKLIYTDIRAGIKVTATLEDVNAVPDEARLHVTEIKDDKMYAAYLEAMDEAEPEIRHTKDNTVLRDISFIMKDEDGKEIEYEPTEGSVKITIEYLENHLQDWFGVEDAAEVKTYHLPLAEGVKAEGEKTIDVKNVKASDINVQELDSDVKTEKKVEVEVDSFSMFAMARRRLAKAADYTTDSTPIDLTTITSTITADANTTGELDRDAQISFDMSTFVVDDYKLAHTVKTNGSDGKTVIHNVWVYDLSRFFDDKPLALVNQSEGDLYDGGTKAGTYRVENNKVIFTIDPDFLYTRTTGIKGSFKFKAQVDSEKIGTRKEYEFTFTGAGTATKLTFKDVTTNTNKYCENGSGNVVVAPNADGSVTLKYHVTFKADASLKTLKMHDELSGNQSYDVNSFEIVKGENWDRVWQHVPSNAITIDGKQADIDVVAALGITSTERNTQYEIRYTTTVQKADLCKALSNSAYWTWDGEKKTEDKKVEITVHKTLNVTKNVTLDGGIYHYTIKVGGPDIDMRGHTIKDMMSDNQVLVTDIKIDPKVNGESTIMPSWTDDNKYDKDTMTELFTYTFPTDKEYKREYTITYNTKPAESKLLSGEQDVKNTVTDEHDGDKGEASANHKHDFGNTEKASISKKWAGWDLEGTEKALTWNIDVSLPEGVSSLSDVIVSDNDAYYDQGANGENYRPHQLTIDLSKIQVEDSAGNLLTKNTDYTVDTVKNEVHFSTLTKNVTIKGIRTVCPVDFTSGGQEYWFSNKAKVSVDGRPGDESEDKKRYVSSEWSMSKNVVHNEADDTYTWTVIINPEKAVFDTDKDLIFEDDIPDGMEMTGFLKVAAEGVDSQGGNNFWWNQQSDCLNVEGKTVSYNINITNAWNKQPYEKAPHGLSGVKYTLTYKTKLTDAARENEKGKDRTFTYKNVARAQDGTNWKNTDCTVTRQYKFLEKKDLSPETILDAKHDVIEYSIVINPDALTLNEGEDLVLTDTIPEGTTFISNDYSFEPADIKDCAKLSLNSATRELKVTVPDKTRITFTYKLKSDDLHFGGHVFKNTATLTGKGTYTDYVEQNHIIKTHSATITGETTSINILKYDEDEFAKNLPGAVFKLYKLEVASDGTISKTTEMGTGATDSNGKLTFTGLAPLNSGASAPYVAYKFVETKAPDGYEINEAYNAAHGYYFIFCSTDESGNVNADAKAKAEEVQKLIEENNTGIKVEVVSGAHTFEVSNKKPSTPVPETGSLKFTKSFVGDKISEENLKKIKFTVKKEGETTGTSFGLSDMTKSGQVYEKQLDDLTPGKYTVIEENAGVTGYSLTKTYEVNGSTSTVAEGNVVKNGDLTIKITNTYSQDKGSLKFTKSFTGDEISEENLKKIKFTVKKEGETTGTSFGLSDMTKSGQVYEKQLDDLTPGKYTVIEENAGVTGYSLTKTYEVNGSMSTSAEGTVEKDKTLEIVISNTYDINEHPVAISKTTVGGSELEGAVLELTDGTGALVDKWTSTTTARTFELKPGTYKFHEVSAPSGYLVADDITFTVAIDGTITVDGKTVDKVVMIDRKKPEETTVPETTPAETMPAETTVPETTPAETTTPSGGGGGDHPHPLPETTPTETTPAETTVPETTPVETTNPGGGHGGPSEEVETDEYGRVRGANRGKNKKGQDGGNVKGANRGKTRTGDESMMSIFGFGFLAAVLVLLGWFGIRFTKRNRR